MIKSFLAERLKERGTTPEKMIEKTRLGRADIRHLLNDSAREVHFDVLEAICDYLECDVGDLLSHQDT